MKYKINKNILKTDINEESILFDAENGIYFRLNHSSKYIYELILSDYSEDEIIKTIVSKFSISDEDATNSYSNFINLALEKKILI